MLRNFPSVQIHYHYVSMYAAIVSLFPSMFGERMEGKSGERLQEQKDDRTICAIWGEGWEWQREGETSTCLMLIGDITYTNNEAEDDNIFCMTSAFVKAVLTQWNGTLNHPRSPRSVCMAHIPTRMHARRDFTSNFPARYHKKRVTSWGGSETRGHFERGREHGLFSNQYTDTLRWEINAGVGGGISELLPDC